MFVGEHMCQKQKGTTRRNQRNESTSISSIWTILPSSPFAPTSDWLISFLRRYIKDSSEKNERFSSTCSFPKCGQLYMCSYLSFFDLSSIVCLLTNSSEFPSTSEPNLCRSSVGFSFQMPVSYWFQRSTFQHLSSSFQIAAYIWDLYRYDLLDKSVLDISLIYLYSSFRFILYVTFVNHINNIRYSEFQMKQFILIIIEPDYRRFIYFIADYRWYLTEIVKENI